MTFLVAADVDARGWSVDRDALSTVILDSWPDAEVMTDPENQVRCVVWSLETEDGPGEAYLSADGTCLYMDVWEQYALRLAVAFRELAPPEVSLVFCDEGYTFDVAVPPGMTVSSLAALLEPSPSSNVLVGGAGVALGGGARAGRARVSAVLIV
jgi:hypothetical protein